MNFIKNIWNGLYNGCCWFLINCFGASEFELQDELTSFLVECLAVLLIFFIIAAISLAICEIQGFFLQRKLKALLLIHEIRIDLLTCLTHVEDLMTKNNLIYVDDMWPELQKAYWEYDKEYNKLIKLLDSRKTLLLIEASIFSDNKKIADRLFKDTTSKINTVVANMDYILS